MNSHSDDDSSIEFIGVKLAVKPKPSVRLKGLIEVVDLCDDRRETYSKHANEFRRTYLSHSGVSVPSLVNIDRSSLNQRNNFVLPTTRDSMIRNTKVRERERAPKVQLIENRNTPLFLHQDQLSGRYTDSMIVDNIRNTKYNYDCNLKERRENNNVMNSNRGGNGYKSAGFRIQPIIRNNSNNGSGGLKFYNNKVVKDVLYTHKVGAAGPRPEQRQSTTFKRVLDQSQNDYLESNAKKTSGDGSECFKPSYDRTIQDALSISKNRVEETKPRQRQKGKTHTLKRALDHGQNDSSEKMIDEGSKKNDLSTGLENKRKNVERERILESKSSSNKGNKRRIRPNSDNSNVILMRNITHLNRSTDKELPNYRFTVQHPSIDWILHDFEINVKSSQVLGHTAGLGAFITYRGGRKLNQRLLDLSQKKISDRLPKNPRTLQPLLARYLDGSSATVKLSGKHLHGHNNSVFQSKTEVLLKARVSGSDVSIKLQGKNLHYDSDEEDHLDHLSCCPNRIGHLSLFTDSDYIRDESIHAFVPPDRKIAFLDVGRYGPVRKEDRKRSQDFDIKNFLFGYEPEGWCFGVSERILGCDQIVDITDDGTGELHEDAKKLVTPYINEVRGLKNNLQQNVYCREKGDHCVNYYFAIDTEMHVGDEVEMLTDYGIPYEPTRERQGYGERNVKGEIFSDNDAATRMKTNFEERFKIEESILNMKAIELYYSLEFLIQTIMPKVKTVTENYISQDDPTDGFHGIPTVRQLRARRRLHWLSHLYFRRVKQLDGRGLVNSLKFGVEAVAEMMEKSMEWTNMLPWKILTENQSLIVMDNQQLEAAFNEETIEEILYEVREKLPNPLDSNIWCPLARDQTKALCHIAFEQLRKSRKINKETLASSFLQCASDFAEKMRIAVKDKSYDSLSFVSGVETGKYIVEMSDENLQILQAGSSIWSNSYALKGAISALIEFGSQHFSGVLERSCDEPVLMVKTKAPSTRDIDSIPSRTKLVEEGSAKINELWYLIWQNIYATYLILIALVDQFSDGSENDKLKAYKSEFLLNLCNSVKVEAEAAQIAIKSGIIKDDEVVFPKIIYVKDNKRHILKYSKSQTVETTQKHGELKHTNSSVKTLINGFSQKIIPSGKVKSDKRLIDGSSRKIASSGKVKSNKKVKSDKKVKSQNPAVDNKRKRSECTRNSFQEVIWKALTALGWKLATGTRPKDFYYLPPGVERNAQFRNRVDYFDSTPKVLEFIRTNKKWKDKPEIKECLNQLEKYNEARRMGKKKKSN